MILILKYPTNRIQSKVIENNHRVHGWRLGGLRPDEAIIYGEPSPDFLKRLFISLSAKGFTLTIKTKGRFTMLTDLQRLDYAETMKTMSEAERTQFLSEKLVTETTDIDVINQIIVDFSNQDTPAEPVEAAAPAEAEVCDAPA